MENSRNSAPKLRMTPQGDFAEVESISLMVGRAPMMSFPELEDPMDLFKFKVPVVEVLEMPKYLYNDSQGERRRVFEKAGDVGVIKYRIEAVQDVPVDEVLESIGLEEAKQGYLINTGHDKKGRPYYELGVRGKADHVLDSEATLAMLMLKLDKFMTLSYGEAYASHLFND